ncbi:MAG: carboxypeptidase regulatory-like domain-containing protein [Terriglobia bacterium]
MRRLLFTSVLMVLLVGVANAQPKPGGRTAADVAADSQERLPVKRVVLYKNGVGYFEHSARVRGTQELNIDFTTAQLNDVLNSLTVVDLGSGRISGVRFNSIAPLSERLKALRLPLSEGTSRDDFLNALRGTRVEVHNGSVSGVGRVLSVETRKTLNPKGEQLAEVTEISLVSDGGELRTFEMGPATSVRIADHDLSDDVGRYLNLIGSAKAMDLRRMTISATGDGERDVFVSYISEVPVWKSTYRILLTDKPDDPPLIQGWAVVDNTIGEDWKGVRLSLIAGAPQSFIQQISQPYYVRRPVVAMAQEMMLTPQTHEMALMAAPAAPVNGRGEGGGIGSGRGGGIGPGEGGGTGGGMYSVGAGVIGGVLGKATGLEGTVRDQTGAVIPNAKLTLRNIANGLVETARADSNGLYRFENAQAGDSSLTVESPGFQRLDLNNIAVSPARMNQFNPTLVVGESKEMVMVAVEAEQPEAEAKTIGDLFEYDIKQTVTIDKNQSALVPIVQAHVDAEKVTLWNANSATALRALWLTNTSGQTLDAGSFNVLEGDTFGGQGLLEAIRPGEKRLVSYAPDPAVHVQAKDDFSEKPISRIVINKGVMLTTREQRATKTYKLFNSDASNRDVIVEHPARDEWKLADNLKPEESSASFYRFRVKLNPKQSAQFVVEEHKPETTEMALTNLTSDQVEVLTKQQRVTPAMEQAFRQVLDQKNGIAALDAQIQGRRQELDAIGTDQARLRENMKALKGSAEEKALTERYTRELNTQEDRLAALHTQVSELKEKREQAAEKLDQTLNAISLSEAF